MVTYLLTVNMFIGLRRNNFAFNTGCVVFMQEKISKVTNIY